MAEALCLVRWAAGQPSTPSRDGRLEGTGWKYGIPCRMATVVLSGPAVLPDRGPESASGEGGVSVLYVESSADRR